MGPLLPVLAAVLVQGLAEAGLVGGSERPWLVLAACVLPYALGAAARRAALRGDFAAAGRRLLALDALPTVAHVLALSTCGWLTTVERLLGRPLLVGWPNAASLAGFVPLVVYGLLAIDARARALDTRPGAAAAARRLNARLFLGSLAPIVLYVVVAGALGRLPAVRAHVDHVGFDAALYALALLLAFLVLMPFALRLSWNTRPLPRSALRELFESVARRARFRCREVLVWDTGHGMANAAIVGVVAPLRLVFLSDALLANLTPRELLAVFAHEMGHARRHHVLVFVAWTAALILGVDLAASRVVPDGEAWAFATLGASLALWYVGFGWLSRRFELDADLFAVDLTGDAQGMIAALEHVGGPHGGSRRSWRHFPTDRRVAFLAAHAHDPSVGRGLRRRVRALAVTGGLACAVVIGLYGRELWSARPVELVAARLALGDAPGAQRAAARVPDAPPELARQVELALELGLGDTADGARVLEAARRAAAEGRATRAFDLLELGALRDPERFAACLQALFEALPAELRDDPEGLGRAAEQGDARVLAALREALAAGGTP